MKVVIKYINKHDHFTIVKSDVKSITLVRNSVPHSMELLAIQVLREMESNDRSSDYDFLLQLVWNFNDYYIKDYHNSDIKTSIKRNLEKNLYGGFNYIKLKYEIDNEYYYQHIVCHYSKNDEVYQEFEKELEDDYINDDTIYIDATSIWCYDKEDK